jgi:iron-sulfur cluster repair protein YtfE (RIC family)
MPIIRHKSLQPLSRDHHHGLILAQILKREAPEYKGLPTTLEGKKEYTIIFYNSELVKHFKNEEEILFPLVKGRSTDVDKLTDEIVNEHRKIENLISEIQNTEDLERILDEFGTLLEKHIRKEERELFTKIEIILTEGELSELETNLK